MDLRTQCHVVLYFSIYIIGFPTIHSSLINEQRREIKSIISPNQRQIIYLRNTSGKIGKLSNNQRTFHLFYEKLRLLRETNPANLPGIIKIFERIVLEYIYQIIFQAALELQKNMFVNPVLDFEEDTDSLKNLVKRMLDFEVDYVEFLNEIDIIPSSNHSTVKFNLENVSILDLYHNFLPHNANPKYLLNNQTINNSWIKIKNLPEDFTGKIFRFSNERF